MSQQSVEEIQQYGKLYSDKNNNLHLSFQKKRFFKNLSVFACLGVFAAFVPDGVSYTPAPLSSRIVIGLANLVIVGLIGLGIGLFIGSLMTLIAAGVCTLIGLLCALLAANRAVQINVWAVDLKTGRFFNGLKGKSIKERVVDGTIKLVPLTKEIADKLKQYGIED